MHSKRVPPYILEGTLYADPEGAPNLAKKPCVFKTYKAANEHYVISGIRSSEW